MATHTVQPGQTIPALAANDTLVFAAGVHKRVYLSVRVAGLKVRGEPGAVIDGEFAVNNLAYWQNAPDGSVSNLEIRNYLKSAIYANPGCHRFKAVALDIHHIGRNANGSVTEPTTGSHGLYLEGGEDYLVERCRLHDLTGFGCQVYSSSGHTQLRPVLRENEAYKCAKGGLAFGAGCKEALGELNRLHENGYGFLGLSGATGVLRNNYSWSNQVNYSYDRLTNGGGNLTTAPTEPPPPPPPPPEPEPDPCATQDALLDRAAREIWRTDNRPAQRIQNLKKFIPKP